MDLLKSDREAGQLSRNTLKLIRDDRWALEAVKYDIRPIYDTTVATEMK